MDFFPLANTGVIDKSLGEKALSEMFLLMIKYRYFILCSFWKTQDNILINKIWLCNTKPELNLFFL